MNIKREGKDEGKETFEGPNTLYVIVEDLTDLTTFPETEGTSVMNRDTESTTVEDFFLLS